MDEREKEGEIKVKDRRRFTSEGEERKPDEDTGEREAEEKARQAKRQPEQEAERGQDLPPIDFVTFILSLATSAQIHMGAIANPQTGRQETNLRAAKETIDLLDILREKTKGNLTPDEERLFEHLLYDLRMMYVDRSKAGGKGEQKT